MRVNSEGGEHSCGKLAEIHSCEGVSVFQMLLAVKKAQESSLGGKAIKGFATNLRGVVAQAAEARSQYLEEILQSQSGREWF